VLPREKGVNFSASKVRGSEIQDSSELDVRISRLFKVECQKFRTV
jgi:hypothetical protein